MSPEARVTAEWALWGKPPDARDDYEVLDCSRGKLGRDEFGEIITRYAPGTLTDLPQVTIGWAGGLDSAYLGLAIQKWSDRQDGLGRDIAITRYFCVPYRQAADGPVSYEALYDAFDGYGLPAHGPVAVAVPGLDPQAIAERVDNVAVSAAALLLTGEQVCVVRGESVTMRDRLRFLDVVAALLPYGLRARLTASTWTDSSAKHRIRLSFAKHAREGAHSVTWQVGEVTAHQPEVVRRYLDLFGKYSREEIVTRFAAMTEPLPFKHAGQALSLFDDSAGPTVLLRTHWASPTRSDAGEILRACAGCLERGEYEELDALVAQLRHITAVHRFTDVERDRYRALIRSGRLLADRRGLPWDLKRSLYESVLAVGCGPAITLDDLSWIVGDGGMPTGTLVDAMLRLPRVPEVTLELALCLDGERQAHVIRSLQSADLVRAAAREPVDPLMVRIVCEELSGRVGDGAEDSGIAVALREHGYLAAEVAKAYPEDGDARLSCLRRLLIAAYGPTLERKAFEEVIASPLTPSSAVLIVAAVSLYGPGASGLLVSGLLDQARLTPETRAEVVARISPPGRSAGPKSSPAGRPRPRPRAQGHEREQARPEQPRPEQPRPERPGPERSHSEQPGPERSRPERLRSPGSGHRREEPVWPLWAKVVGGALAVVVLLVILFIWLW